MGILSLGALFSTGHSGGTAILFSTRSKLISDDQESRRLRGLQANFYCLLKPTIPPLSTSSDFACSVSSLGRCSLHYPPGHLSFRPSHLAERALGKGWTINAHVVEVAVDAPMLH